MTRQFALPGIPPKPPRPRLWRMQVVDAGHLPGGAAKGIVFECPRCGHNTDWIEDRWTITKNRRGLPCPCCNETSKKPKETVVTPDDDEYTPESLSGHAIETSIRQAQGAETLDRANGSSLAILHQKQAEAVAAGRRAEVEGQRVVYIHGRPYADPADAENDRER